MLDTIFVDFKHPDPEMHEKYTGVSNALLLANLTRLNGSDFSGSLHLHIPLVRAYEWLPRDYELAELGSPAPEYIQERVDFMCKKSMLSVPIRVGGGFTLSS